MITLQQGTIYMGTAAPASGGGGSGDAVWGSITGTLSNQTDLQTALNAKQDTLTAGSNITITNNVISATGGGGTVDQTYNASSANAQSGVAIAGAGFLQNQSTGSGGLAIGFETANNVSASTVLGSGGVITGAVHGAVVIGNNTSSSGGIAIGRDIHTNDGDIIIGDYTSSALVKDRVNQNPVFALSDYASSDHESYALLDLTTGIIPDNRLSGNIARTSDIPSVPTVNNATLTITQGGVSKGTFTANASSNVTIALDSGGGSVDQTYNASSTNAQSGVAIAGAGFLRNQAAITSTIAIGNTNTTPSSILIGNNMNITSGGGIDVLGKNVTVDTGSNNSNDVVIGSICNVTASDCVVVGQNITASTDKDILLGYNYNSSNIIDRTSTNPVLAVTNTASTDYEGYALVDLQTGIIPDNRLSSNIARVSDIPSVSIDNTTINKNSSNQLQAIGVKEVRTDTAIKLWHGTEQQWNQGNPITWYNWLSGNSELTWSDIDISSITTKALYSTVYANNKYTVGASGTIIESSDGSNWSAIDISSITTSRLNSIIYVNNKYIAVGASGTIIESSDGNTWSSVNISSITTNDLYQIIYANNKYTAVGASGTIIESSDGSNWISVTSGVASHINSIVYANNKYIAVCANGTLIESSDGSNWSAIDISSITKRKLNSIVYANNKYIAVGARGTMIESSNGSTWSSVYISAVTTNDLYQIIYANNKYTAVGASGTIIESSDGSNWTSETSGTSNVLNGITYENNKYIAVGSNGTILSSSAGVSLSCYTLESTPTTASTVYSAPDTTSTLTITAVGTGTITLSDTNTYNYNASGNQTTYQSVGEAHPDYLCFIDNIGVKMGTTSIITVNQT